MSCAIDAWGLVRPTRAVRPFEGICLFPPKRCTLWFCCGLRTMANKREQYTGGRGGIRTHGTLAGTPVFKTGALNHSATLPSLDVSDLAGACGRGKRQIGRYWRWLRITMEEGPALLAESESQQT